MMQRYKIVIHLHQLMGGSYQDDQITNDVIMQARTEGWCWIRGMIPFTQWMFWYNIVTLKQKNNMYVFMDLKKKLIKVFKFVNEI